jgi:hypothetical protein
VTQAEDVLFERRLGRLHDELVDHAVPLPIETADGRVLLEELDYARFPPVHEGRIPRYGAIVSFGTRPQWAKLKAPTKLESHDTDLSLLRSLADGRSSFVVRGTGGKQGLVVFDHSLEFEASAARLRAETGAFVVQRVREGLVRVCGPDGVVSWDGVEWSYKPLAEQHAAPVRRLVPQLAPQMLAGLMEFCVHWLSAGRVGATLVVALRGQARDLGHLDLSGAITPPRLSVARRDHFPALLSVLAQRDRAAIVDPDGTVTALDVGLSWSDRAERTVGIVGGMRHTSARRFSFEEPDAVVFVVSQDGPATVFSDGTALTMVRADPCRSGFPLHRLSSAEPDPDTQTTVMCPRCERLLVVDQTRFEGWHGEPERLPCPVCGTTLALDAYRSAIRGVLKP